MPPGLYVIRNSDQIATAECRAVPAVNEGVRQRDPFIVINTAQRHLGEQILLIAIPRYR